MAERELRARLGCSRLLLARLAGADGFQSASRIQSAAFVELARRAKSKLQASQRAVLSDLALRTGFADEHLASVLDVLSPGEEAKARGAMQNYEAIPAFLSNEDWDNVDDEDANATQAKAMPRCR